MDGEGHERLNGIDRFWRRLAVAPTADGRRFAHELSYATLYATAGFSALDPAFRGGGASRAGRNLLVTTEAVAIDAVLVVTVKRLARRERPYARFGGGSGDPDDHQSFFSGHASLAFAWATAACEVRRYERPGASGSGCVLPYAAAGVTALLRTRADKHYLTDVLVGAAVGYAVGRVVPALHDTRPAPGGARRAMGLPFQVRFSW